ncbi:hypothetical protein THAOC_26811, partial [Thalassiosira oceanica]
MAMMFHASRLASARVTSRRQRKQGKAEEPCWLTSPALSRSSPPLLYRRWLSLLDAFSAVIVRVMTAVRPAI